jgi:hypothetical protein
VRASRVFVHVGVEAQHLVVVSRDRIFHYDLKRAERVAVFRGKPPLVDRIGQKLIFGAPQKRSGDVTIVAVEPLVDLFVPALEDRVAEIRRNLGYPRM